MTTHRDPDYFSTLIEFERDLLPHPAPTRDPAAGHGDRQQSSPLRAVGSAGPLYSLPGGKGRVEEFGRCWQ